MGTMFPPIHYSSPTPPVGKTSRVSAATMALLVLLIMDIRCTVSSGQTGKEKTLAEIDELKSLVAKLEKLIGDSDDPKTLLCRIDQSSNRWNRSDCDKGLMIWSDQTVERVEGEYTARTCRAEAMASQYFGIAYFEVEIVENPGMAAFSIGLSTREMPLADEWLGDYGDTCAFWGHNIEGSVPEDGSRWVDGNASFGIGDVVGCGVNLATRQIIYTLNGKRLDTSKLFVRTADLYPTVSLAKGSIAKTNFGPNFTYKIPKLFVIEQPNNRWNPFDCHEDLLIESDKTIRQVAGKCGEEGTYYFECARSCRAESMTSQHIGIAYFEVQLLKKPGYLKYENKTVRSFWIGLSTNEMPLNESVGALVGTHAYNSDGFFFHLPTMSCTTYCPEEDKPPHFGVGDVVGCGLNLATRQLIYTLNGKRLDTSKLFANTTDLFPTVSLSYHSVVLANFGPNFTYDISMEY